MTESHRPLKVAQPAWLALHASPSIADLARRSHESTARLRAILPLIPEPLHATVQAGPLDEKSWCLIVTSNAAAAKLRQMMPTLQATLQSKGLKVNAIRLKILAGRR